MPGRTDELIQRVAEVNPKTIVVTQSVRAGESPGFILRYSVNIIQGSAISMPWVDSVPAIVHAWYLGNATGDAIADVLFGKVNPSGKLPLTFPARLEDVPSFGHFKVDDGKVLPLAHPVHSMFTLVQVRYAEGSFVVSNLYGSASLSLLLTVT
jgi:beta-glucosidase